MNETAGNKKSSASEPLVVAKLKTMLRRGRLLKPSDEGYDATRLIWSGMFDRRPLSLCSVGEQPM